MLKHYFLPILLAAAGVISSGCSAEDFERMGDGQMYSGDGTMNSSSPEAYAGMSYTAIVTVKKAASDSVFFQLSDTQRLFPVNFQGSYSRMERIICGVTVTGAKTVGFGPKVTVEWSESLDEGTVGSAASGIGDDPIEVVDDWMTSVEDGYLTLHYSTVWGKNPSGHKLSILTGTHPSDPYFLVLRHDRNGDGELESGDALVYFDINSLPSTGGAYKALTLKWTTGEGQYSERIFSFRSRE